MRDAWTRACSITTRKDYKVKKRTYYSLAEPRKIGRAIDGTAVAIEKYISTDEGRVSKIYILWYFAYTPLCRNRTPYFQHSRARITITIQCIFQFDLITPV